MSSISRARSSAKPSAADGVLAISGEPWSGAMALGPLRDQLRQQEPPFERRDGGRQLERFIGKLAGGGFGKGNLVFVQIAERDDARQDGGVAFQLVEEGIAGETAGAPRRQIER